MYSVNNTDRQYGPVSAKCEYRYLAYKVNNSESFSVYVLKGELMATQTNNDHFTYNFFHNLSIDFCQLI